MTVTVIVIITPKIPSSPRNIITTSHQSSSRRHHHIIIGQVTVRSYDMLAGARWRGAEAHYERCATPLFNEAAYHHHHYFTPIC